MSINVSENASFGIVAEKNGNYIDHDMRYNIAGTDIRESLTVPVAHSHVDKFHEYLMRKLKASDAHKVKEFTEGSMGVSLPTKPQPMTKEQVIFLVRMMTSEIVELAQTVTDSHEEARKLVADAASTDLNPDYVRPKDPLKLAADQADAVVDAWYYGLNALAKVGVNASSLFSVVHEANMSKRGADGKFKRRADGKIEKPANWREPDIVGEIKRQDAEGSW